MNLKPIKSEADYEKALKRVREIFHAKKETPEGDELEILILLIEKYELDTQGEYPLPDPIEAIKFHLERLGLTQTDFAKIVGQKSRASEILNRKRTMSLEIIRKISKALSISADTLIQPYELAA